MYDNLTRTNLEFAHNEAEKRIAQLEEELANADYQLEGRDLEIKELKAQLEQAKEIIDRFLDFEASAMERGIYIADDLREKAEAFLKE